MNTVLSPIAYAIKSIYQMGKSIDEYIDQHIAEMKISESQTIACTGRVLEAAKHGFGLGYMSSVAIIAAGQLLLGSTLAAASTVATAVTLTNPIAMTCAAIGAIYYGWGALSDKERSAILSRLAEGLAMGIELVRALISFTIETTKDFLSSKQLTEFKEYIKTQAAQFGKSLYDVTHGISDLVKGAVETAGALAEHAAEATSSATRKAVDLAGDAATKVAGVTSETAKGVTDRLLGTDKSKP